MADREKTIRKFQRAATQRLKASALLLEHGFHLEAVYIAGYSVECVLKALILSRTPQSLLAPMVTKVTKAGAKGHDFEFLKGILVRKPIQCVIPPEAAELLELVANWSTDLRYDVGQLDRGEAEQFTEAAAKIVDWCMRS